jgi:hypothetical protein
MEVFHGGARSTIFKHIDRLEVRSLLLPGSSTGIDSTLVANPIPLRQISHISSDRKILVTFQSSHQKHSSLPSPRSLSPLGLQVLVAQLDDRTRPRSLALEPAVHLELLFRHHHHPHHRVR